MANYNVNIPPQWGVDSPFAMIPGALPAVTPTRVNPTLLGTPQSVGMPNPFGDLSAVYPNLGKSNAATSALILSQLAGELSPETQRAIQDAAARYGVTSGMAGGGLARNRTARDLGRSSQDIQQQGLQNYNSILPMISRTQTVSPELQASINTRNANAIDDFAVRNAGYQNQFELANQQNDRAYDFQNVDIAGTNAINAAAPNPGKVAAESRRLFDEYLQKTQGGPSGGGGGSNVIRPSGGSGISFDPDGRASFQFGGSGAGSGFSGGGGFGSNTSRIASPIVPSYSENQSADLNRQNNNPQRGYGPNYATDFSGNPFDGLDFSSSYGTRTDTVKPWANVGAGPTPGAYTFPSSDNQFSPYYDWTAPVGGDDGLWWLENQV